MTFKLQTDKNPFQFHIIYIGMNPLKRDAAPGVDGVTWAELVIRI